jgi:DNA mismatch repair protein MutH
MPFPSTYNKKNANDILRYAKWLIGKTFYNVLEEDMMEAPPSSLVEGYAPRQEKMPVLEGSAIEYGNAQRKGGLGNLIEEKFFHYTSNSKREADFSAAGLELKVTPYEERHGRGQNSGTTYYVAGERLVLSMIDFNERPVEFDLLKSHLWQKCSKILLIYYLRSRGLGDNLKYRINFVDIFSPNAKDLIIIKQDYFCIMQKIASGKANEISESDTMYLGACTKGSTAAKSIVLQIENGIPAQKRAFCYKTSYMTTVLNEHFINASRGQEEVVTDKPKLARLGFEGYIQDKVNRYVGKTDYELCQLLDVDYNGNKSQWIKLAFSMLGIKSNKAEEFLKANIVVKATRIEEDGSIRENTSFPPFKFMDFVEEEWVDADEEEDTVENADYSKPAKRPSTVQTYFSTTKFLFVVFKKSGPNYVLKGCRLWNMPFYDLNVTVRAGWEHIKQVIEDGVQFTMKKVKTGARKGKYTVYNNLPGRDDNPIIHIRPHAQKSYYKLDDYEDGNPADGNPLPDGRWMTTQCFWLNNSYVQFLLSSM